MSVRARRYSPLMLSMSGRGEMVDTIGLGPIDRKIMGVQVPPPAPK